MTNFIDAKGKACPIPVVLARQAITAGADALTIEVDNATAVENLKRLAGSLGMAITVREIAPGRSKASVRTNELVDASAVCAVFGGGGHKMASGCTVDLPPQTLADRMLDTVNEIWK